jgi:exodeoxyribonuclease V beta subunit
VTPLRLRVLGRTGAGPLGPGGFPAVAALRRRVAADVAADVVRLLERRAVLRTGEPRELQPGDVAVLVRTHTQAALVHEALEAAEVPCVVASSSSVFATPSARDWLWLLQALEQPHRAGRARLAALTPLVGWTAERLDAADDTAFDEVGGLLRDTARRVEQAGPAAAFELLSARTGLERRVLAVEQGERRLTDLRHLAQLLDRAAVEQSLGLSALVAWLGERVEDPDGLTSVERSRRLESDAAAVQIVTVHVSKGLEFPVVLVPYGWDSTTHPSPATLRLHDPSGARVLDVGGKGGPGWDARKRAAEAEDDGEELRLLYVALTRAQCAVVAWWAPSSGASASPLQRLLMGRTPGQAMPEPRAKVPEDAVARARLAAWGWPDEIAVEPVDEVEQRHLTPTVTAPAALAAARFDRRLDHDWRRTSYSALTAAAHDEPAVRSEPEARETSDEPAAGAPGDAEVLPEGDLPSPFEGLPAGAAFGTLVHDVLERVDPTAADLPAELRARCREAVARRLARVDPAALAAGLLPVLRTPLAGGTTLAGLGPQDRLAELDFELPLSGGETPTAAQARLGDVAALLRRHLPADDALAAYPDALEAVDAPPLRGFLSGSIDAVLRLPGPSYVVVDYKTNRLAQGPLRVGHYSRPAMACRDGPRALPAAGPALRRRAAPVPALATARLRPRAAPRRRAVPVRARHGRSRHTARLRRLRLAAACGAGARAVRPAGRRVRPARATGLLAVFAEAGVLAAADVHVARRLGELAREADEQVLLAAALAVRAVRLGATCLELDRLADVALDPADEERADEERREEPPRTSRPDRST